jgi:hypothetical protein
MLLRIEAAHFVAGIVVGKRAAPIIAYMRDWPPEKIKTYCRKKGWRVTELEAPPQGSDGALERENATN